MKKQTEMKNDQTNKWKNKLKKKEQKKKWLFEKAMKERKTYISTN